MFRGSPDGKDLLIRSDEEIGEILEQAKRLAKDGFPLLVNVHLARTDFRVRPAEQVLSEYLAIVFNSYYGKQAVAGVLVGAAQKHFNVKAAKAALIPLPPIEEQHNFVEKVSDVREQCRTLESGYQRKIWTLTELKQSLLQKAFSGELTAVRAEEELESATA